MSVKTVDFMLTFVVRIFLYLAEFQYIYSVKQFTMNILNFTQQFPDEASCIAFLKEQRIQSGVVCKQCGGINHIWNEKKLCFECKDCHSRQSIRTGTVMEHSKLPFRYWIATMFLLTCTKKSFSTEELRRQLGHKRYQPIWEMVCKLRDVMGKRDSEYKLTDQIELDEGFFSTEIPQEEKSKPLKRGRGSQKKATVLVMIESSPVPEPKEGGKSKTVGHLKMQVIPDLKADTITEIVKEQIEASVELTTDNSTSYGELKEHVKEHTPHIIKPKEVSLILPWVHIAISNAKRLLLDVHHKLKTEYLQYYLNEFCYKFNRRYFGQALFGRLVLAAMTSTADFKSKIYNRTLCG